MSDNLNSSVVDLGPCPDRFGICAGRIPRCLHFRYNCPTCVTEWMNRRGILSPLETIYGNCFRCLAAGSPVADPFLFDVDDPQEPYITRANKIGWLDACRWTSASTFSADAPVWSLMATDSHEFFVKMQDAYKAGYEKGYVERIEAGDGALTKSAAPRRNSV